MRIFGETDVMTIVFVAVVCDDCSKFVITIVFVACCAEAIQIESFVKDDLVTNLAIE